MTTRRTLTSEEVEQARTLRDGGMAWHRIGKIIGCDEETIQRRIDPGFAERRAAHRQRLRDVGGKSASNIGYSSPPSIPKSVALNEPDIARKAAEKADEAFQLALQTAIARNEETCPVGVVTASATERPILHQSRGLPVSHYPSTSQMCAEFAL